MIEFQNEQNNLHLLPIELLLHIYSFLGVIDFGNLALADKESSKIARDNQLWKMKLAQHFPKAFAQLDHSDQINYYLKFKETYALEYEHITDSKIKKLFSLVKEGDIERIKNLEIKIEELLTGDANGISILEWVKREEILNYLWELVSKCYLENGINFVDNYGNSILHWAAIFKRNKECFEVFIEQGWNIDAVNNPGGTPLFIAAQNGHLEIVKLLLSRGANANTSLHGSGSTPLHIAADVGHLDVVKLLLDKNVNVDAVMSTGETALFLAAQSGHLEIVKLLLSKGANANISFPENGATPLHAAAAAGQLDVVKFLLDQNVNVDAILSTGETPLFIAAQNGHLEIVKLLLSKGANANTSLPENETTLLHAAAEEGHLNVVKFLLDQNVNVDPVLTGATVTPLYLAAGNGHLEVLKLLLSKGGNVKFAANKIGSTPLHIAAYDGNQDIVSLLIENGAEVNAVLTTTGETPLHFAAKKDHYKVVETLLKNNADINKTNKNDETPLYIAAFNCHRNIVEILLDKGANPNLSVQNGWAPLHAAVAKGNKYIVEALLKKGADILTINGDGNTPFDMTKNDEILNLLNCEKTFRTAEKLLKDNQKFSLHFSIDLNNEFTKAKAFHPNYFAKRLHTLLRENLKNKIRSLNDQQVKKLCSLDIVKFTNDPYLLYLLANMGRKERMLQGMKRLNLSNSEIIDLYRRAAEKFDESGEIPLPNKVIEKDVADFLKSLENVEPQTDEDRGVSRSPSYNG